MVTASPTSPATSRAIQLQDWSKQNPKATPQQWRDQFYQTVQPYTDAARRSHGLA